MLRSGTPFTWLLVEFDQKSSWSPNMRLQSQARDCSSAWISPAGCTLENSMSMARACRHLRVLLKCSPSISWTFWSKMWFITGSGWASWTQTSYWSTYTETTTSAFLPFLLYLSHLHTQHLHVCYSYSTYNCWLLQDFGSTEAQQKVRQFYQPGTWNISEMFPKH